MAVRYSTYTLNHTHVLYDKQTNKKVGIAEMKDDGRTMKVRLSKERKIYHSSLVDLKNKFVIKTKR